MQVEISVAGIDNSTLKFSTNGTDNKFGIRLYNIRLYAVDGEGVELIQNSLVIRSIPAI